MKVAVPRFAEQVAPCFEYSATITIFSIRRHEVVEQQDFRLQSRDALDRVRLMRDQQVDTLICGGLHERVEQMLCASGIRVISWVAGEVDDLLNRYIDGRLTAGEGRPGGRPGAAGGEGV
ncbi:MAG: NifB/NifX family molybdenum-iron cluster-binding protein [Deltaproteobacteria bacterium]|nr:NifB/NifX family molybdenum-iron cluster-binding protein [Deltaproteobacteria bacterium]